MFLFRLIVNKGRGVFFVILTPLGIEAKYNFIASRTTLFLLFVRFENKEQDF